MMTTEGAEGPSKVEPDHRWAARSSHGFDAAEFFRFPSTGWSETVSALHVTNCRHRSGFSPELVRRRNE